MNILVIDAQGGGLGKQVITALKKNFPDMDITAVGTNTMATGVMLKAGAPHAATGENAVVVGCRKADIIIGIPDERRGQKVKAYVVLKKHGQETEETKERLLAHMAQHVAGYALPKEIEFRKELPKTLVGKVAYRILEEEEAKKNAAR